MPSLALEQLEKRYDHHVVVDRVSLSVRDGEFVSLLGPSGCGKTTILRMIAGLIEPSGGRVLVEDRDITRLPVNQRRIGLVFQSYALFPHLSVFENVAFGLRRQGVGGAELAQRVETALRSVRLQAYAQRMPRALSGGQQQRVALARSIAPRPRLLLLDEPLSNLDASLRDEMQIELKRLQREVGITTVFVTHDQTEAMALSDRVCVLAQGRVQQFDTPEAVYHRPANAFVAGFVGRPNRLRGTVRGEIEGDTLVQLPDGSTLRARGAPDRRWTAGRALEVVIRQEDVSILDREACTPAHSCHGVRVMLRAFTGARVQYVVAFTGGQELLIEAASKGAHAAHAAGEALVIGIAPEHVLLNDPEAER